MTLIFSSESCESIFFEFGKGGPKGGPGEEQFYFEITVKQFFQFLLVFSNQNWLSHGLIFQFQKHQKVCTAYNEKNLTYDDLVNSDEAFFTGTAVEITPITTLDNKPINQGERGSLTAQLQQKFEDIVSGNNKSYRSWLTYT